VSAGSAGDERPLIAVLDYGIGNLRSAQKGFERAGADARLTADPGLIADAVGVVLPGVGHFGTCMTQLRDAGLEEPAIAAIDSGRPFFGICVGMQMLFESSDEAPGVSGLGVLPGTIHRLPPGLPRPQMQWNQLDIRRRSVLLDGLPTDPWMYFVHSYAVDTEEEYVVATCEYGTAVTAMVERGDSLWATQFHPEKSGDRGHHISENFLEQARCGV